MSAGAYLTRVRSRGPDTVGPWLSEHGGSGSRKDGYDQLHGLHDLVQASGIEVPLLELIRMRVSQINGCVFCIDMHSKDARAAGETEQRLYALSAWRETGFFSPRERAALGTR